VFYVLGLWLDDWEGCSTGTVRIKVACFNFPGPPCSYLRYLNENIRWSTFIHTHTCHCVLLSIWFSCITHISWECLRDRDLRWALVMHCRVSMRCGMQCGTRMWCGMRRHAGRNSSRLCVILMLLCVWGVYVRLCHTVNFLLQKPIYNSVSRYLYMESREVTKTAFNKTWRTNIITFCIMYQPRDQQSWLFVFVVFTGVSTNRLEYWNKIKFIFLPELYITILK
jgi:hypothetical protein